LTPLTYAENMLQGRKQASCAKIKINVKIKIIVHDAVSPKKKIVKLKDPRIWKAIPQLDNSVR